MGASSCCIWIHGKHSGKSKIRSGRSKFTFIRDRDSYNISSRDRSTHHNELADMEKLLRSGEECTYTEHNDI